MSGIYCIQFISTREREKLPWFSCKSRSGEDPFYGTFVYSDRTTDRAPAVFLSSTGLTVSLSLFYLVETVSASLSTLINSVNSFFDQCRCDISHFCVLDLRTHRTD